MARSQGPLRVEVQIEGFLILIFLVCYDYCLFNQCRIGASFDTVIAPGPLWALPGILLLISCWAEPGVPKVVSRRVMPMTVAPKCLVESKTRVGTSKLRALYLAVVVVDLVAWTDDHRVRDQRS